MSSNSTGSYREVWSLAYPAIITMMSQTAMWTVDTMMVGHVGKTELAAVGLGGLMVFTLYSFFIGASYGLTPYVSQSFGARRFHDCGKYMWQGIYLSIVAGALILVIRAFNPWTVDMLGPKAEVKPLCLTYTSIRMLSGWFFVLHYFLSNYFRGIGDTRTPMKIAIIANIVNIVIDYFLIFGKGPFPALGVAGAAWATFTANIVQATILFAVAVSPEHRSEYGTLTQWRLRIVELWRLLRVGTPIGLHYALEIGSFLAFSAYIGRMGTDQLAANQIVIQILAWSFLPCNGFAIAATTLMGQYIGAGKPDIARTAGYRAIHLGVLYTLGIALIYLLFPEGVVRLFNDDPRVLAYGGTLVLIAAAFQIFDGVQIVAGGALRGAGDTTVPMIYALGGGWLVFLPAAYICGTVLDGGVTGAWLGACSYVILLAVAMVLRLRTGRWRKMRLAGVDVADSTSA